MKIRPEAEKKLLAALATGADDTIGQAAGSALADDLFYDDILTAVKSINHHIKQGDLNFNRQKIDRALKHRTALKRLTRSGDKDLRAMARSYLKTLDDIDGSVTAGGRKKIGVFDRFLKREPVVKPSSEKIPAVKRTILYGDQKQVERGQIRVVKEDIEFGKYHRNFTSGGLEYRLDLDGVDGIYRPFIKENYFAHQGQLELRIAADCTPEAADKLLSSLERLGIEASFAAPDDGEILYLAKMAYILKEDNTPSWKKMWRGLDTGKASPAERVKAMRQYWSDRLGVADVTKIPGYDPQGRYSIMSSAWKTKREAGYRQQLRFDLTDDQLKRELKDYGLYHSLTDGTDAAKVLDAILEHNGAMISTVEKMRVGVPVGGMSPSADMESGGASYFFTRIRKLPSRGGGHESSGFYFKPELLRRMDAITYENDKYGRVIGDHVRQHRKTSIQDFKRIEALRSSDETIFKNGVTLLDNIQVVSVRDETERKRVLEVFRKHGLTRLPDGRRVQDIVTMVR